MTRATIARSGPFDVDGRRMRLNAVPDAFDHRDLIYRSRLERLPSAIAYVPSAEEILLQHGQSCVGHAVAAMINRVLNRDADRPVRVSPYMLYYLARRYDEFAGEDDVGSSL